MEQFGFSTEVATLTVSLFIAGYCVGPLVWGPLSEDVSRFLTALTACIYSISLL
jgi:sugar phosphate permease